MTMVQTHAPQRALREAAMLLLCLVHGSQAVAATSLPAAVAMVLNGQTSGPMASLQGGRKQVMIDCVTGVLNGLPGGQKREITQGSGFDDIQDRFGKVVMANRAEWKQKIAKSCGKFAI